MDLENVTQSKKKNGELYTGEGTVWKQESDGVLSYGVSDHLTKTVKIEKGVSYIFSYYNDGYDNGKLKYMIKDANGKELLDNKVSGSTFTSETDEVTIDIYSNPEVEFDKAYKFAIPKLRPETLPEGRTEADYENLLGDNNENTNFITKGWKSEKYNSKVNKENTEIVDGETYWKQVGDGVACLKDSSIVMDTDISANQYVNIAYFLGYDGYNADGITIDLLDSKNKLLSHNTLKDETGGEYILTADASGGEGKIKIRINGKADSRITPS